MCKVLCIQLVFFEHKNSMLSRILKFISNDLLIWDCIGRYEPDIRNMETTKRSEATARPVYGK